MRYAFKKSVSAVEFFNSPLDFCGRGNHGLDRAAGTPFQFFKSIYIEGIRHADRQVIPYLVKGDKEIFPGNPFRYGFDNIWRNPVMIKRYIRDLVLSCQSADNM